MDEQPMDHYQLLVHPRIKYIEILSPLCAWDLHDCQCNHKQLEARRRYKKVLDEQSAHEIEQGY